MDDIICIDETSFNSHEVRKHCYSKLGHRCLIKTTNQEVFKKYTGIFAISNRGCLAYEIYKVGGITSERLTEFLNKFIDTLHNKLIILDNASSHRNQQIQELINRQNKLLYAVPYQHYTNAIEQYFSVVKTHLRKYKGITLIELINNLQKVVGAIPPRIYQNLFEGSYHHMQPYLSTCESFKPKTCLKIISTLNVKHIDTYVNYVPFQL